MYSEGTLGNAIRKARKENEFTLEELGKKINITHAYLSRIENNKVVPNDELLKKIAKELTYFDTDEILNDFRILAGYYDTLDENSDIYNELKASGRLEIDYFDPEHVDENVKQIKGIDKYLKKRDHKRLVENPYYKLNYLLDTNYKVFYDLKLNDYDEKTVTVELPPDFKEELYKTINMKVIELIKNYPELLLSISDKDAIEKYRKEKDKKDKQIIQNLLKNDVDYEKVMEFMRTTYDEGKLY
ncbi:helix-turn-helix transcriptional regulator [Staphylococcus sp. GDH8C109P]|uniref:helix-turn-helix domain-containing protein n=1 Tax=Staphylococcus sp. GDH8C109P TaxID=2804088 RepID=UPI001AEBA7EA|nr:helix-turn-helix transcriptional regulator [Staphylococcus sp. GDH8C109P]